MRRKEYGHLLVVTASALLVIVGLLAFGEQARRGHYHLDGGRGWDLPPATSLDAGHIQLYHPVSPRPVISFDLNEPLPAAFLETIELPIPKLATPHIWFGLRSPPAA
ncbi:MAG: hypothetical protein ACRD2B_05060 [Terriglobia bacterium]